MKLNNASEAFKYASLQYEFVRESRLVLFAYCKTIDASHFLQEHSNFGRGVSIRNLLVHVANTYEFWIASCALQKQVAFTSYDSVQNIQAVIALYNEVDKMMYEFMQLFGTQEKKEIVYEIKGVKSSTDPFKLFSHVITHEFHHKGQVLSISRQLGYTPVDTDIMR